MGNCLSSNSDERKKKQEEQHHHHSNTPTTTNTSPATYAAVDSSTFTPTSAADGEDNNHDAGALPAARKGSIFSATQESCDEQRCAGGGCGDVAGEDLDQPRTPLSGHGDTTAPKPRPQQQDGPEQQQMISSPVTQLQPPQLNRDHDDDEELPAQQKQQQQQESDGGVRFSPPKPAPSAPGTPRQIAADPASPPLPHQPASSVDSSDSWNGTISKSSSQQSSPIVGSHSLLVNRAPRFSAETVTTSAAATGEDVQQQQQQQQQQEHHHHQHHHHDKPPRHRGIRGLGGDSPDAMIRNDFWDMSSSKSSNSSNPSSGIHTPRSPMGGKKSRSGSGDKLVQPMSPAGPPEGASTTFAFREEDSVSSFRSNDSQLNSQRASPEGSDVGSGGGGGGAGDEDDEDVGQPTAIQQLGGVWPRHRLASPAEPLFTRTASDSGEDSEGSPVEIVSRRSSG